MSGDSDTPPGGPLHVNGTRQPPPGARGTSGDSDTPPGGPLEVNGSRGAPLRECVREALEQYLAELDGYEASNLAEMVRGQVEPPLIEVVMAHAKGNQTRAAAILGYNRATLRKKIRHYNLG